MNEVAVFTLNGCRMCSALKQRLKNENIRFHDIEITLNRDLWKQILEQTKEDALPTVFIQTDNEGNGLVYSPGRDFQDIEEIVEIIQNNI